MVLFLPTTDNFYKFCSTIGLIIMIGPATAVTILTVYTTDMFEKVELVTAALQVDMMHKKTFGWAYREQSIRVYINRRT